VAGRRVTAEVGRSRVGTNHRFGGKPYSSKYPCPPNSFVPKSFPLFRLLSRLHTIFHSATRKPPYPLQREHAPADMLWHTESALGPTCLSPPVAQSAKSFGLDESTASSSNPSWAFHPMFRRLVEYQGLGVLSTMRLDGS
jgi:hypothetical protein